MNKYLRIRPIAVTSAIGLLNSFYYDNLNIMLLLCLVEVACLLFLFLNHKYTEYICFYLIFLAFSMESGNFVGAEEFYGFKNFRIAGVNIAVWMLFPLLFKAIINMHSIKRMADGIHYELLYKLTFFSICGTIMSIIIFAVNDYGFTSKAGSTKELIKSFYAYLLPFFTIVSLSWALLKDVENLLKIKQYLFSCIPATAIVFISCVLTGNYGNRMGLASLQVSEIYFLLIATLVLISYNVFSNIEKSILIISGLIISIFSLTYNASGKIIIILILTPLIWLYILKKQGKGLSIILYLVLGIVTTPIISQTLSTILNSDNMVLQSKLSDVEGLLNFGANNWLLQIPESPRMRITEFINVGYEYLLHPWYAVFGKGFCGGIQDHLALFTFLDESAFSSWELELGAYRGLHESFNVFFLVGGISGLYILLSLMSKILHNIHLTPWLMFGGMWLFLFYGYHMNVSIYGITSLVVGMIEVSLSKQKQ